MNKIKIVLFLCLIAVSYFGNTQQKYSFDYLEKEQTEISSPFVKKHFLGDEIARQIQMLKEAYTYTVVEEISGAETTEIEKPSIFASVNKVSRHLKKNVKNGSIPKEDAKEILGNILKIALNIRYQNTIDLEAELWKLKKPTEIAKLYSERIILSF